MIVAKMLTRKTAEIQHLQIYVNNVNKLFIKTKNIKIKSTCTLYVLPNAPNREYTYACEVVDVAGGVKMLEKEIEKILATEVKKLGGKAYKFVSPGNSGVPDRIVIFPKKSPVFVELKTDTGVLTNLQAVQVKRLRELGQTVEVVKGITGLIKFFGKYGYPQVSIRLSEKYKGVKTDGV